ncbi:formylglycine-generating enzyme family protein [Arthrobacter castelli]|uniref:formylglycine-generating enzyme family protein n=1 Tax=Arthrobacter castelli TaxID=271431 RepID=UPI00041DE045|nr:formylglycine-generating enzyme family protein [Arthrobacter castelli]
MDFQPSSSRANDDVLIPAGTFEMGDSFSEGYPSDGEQPVHPVFLDSFRIDVTAVTNAQFAEFTETTGYRTESEIFGSSAVFYLAVRAHPSDILGPAQGAPWWFNVRGADWAHPSGPDSHWSDIPDHPVVQVSWNDAQAYCRWASRRLLTEAEWEYAARGRLHNRRYPWGDELLDADGHHQCNIWQGTFPTQNLLDDGYLTTSPVRSFPPNGHGLFEASGNVWEWCNDWFLPKYYRNSPDRNPPGPTIGEGRVMRGGSYLCHESYCNRYRVAARSANTPDSASGNCGFRTAGGPLA